MEFQIRDENFGLALYDADSGHEALYAFFADRVKGDLRPRIEERPDGSEAEVVVDGERYRAVRRGRLRLVAEPTDLTGLSSARR